MQQIALPLGTAVQVARAGSVARIVNDPSIDYYLAHDAASGGSNTPDPGVIGAYILVGFDNDPSAATHDAIVPPFSEASFVVPASVATLHLLWATDPGATITQRTTNAYNSIPVLVEWLADVVATGIRPLYGIGPFFFNTGTLQGRLVVPMDRWQMTWPPRPPEYLYNQGGAASVGAHVRPRLCPDISQANRISALANTIFNLAGQYGVPVGASAPSASTTFKFEVIHKIIVTLETGGLFVMGSTDLTVGSPGTHETGRVNLAAKQPFVFDYGEGIETWSLNYGQTGALKAYTDTAQVVDLTIIGSV